VLRDVTAIRYVTPLREGGSLPGIVEGDDLGTYVAKFTGAGQGRKTLIAEVIVGELARRLGLRVPELVRMHLDPVIGRAEPDQEVQELLKASGGLNLGMDFLPGAFGFDPLAFEVDPAEAGRVLWLDAFTGNVDRSWRNPNLLVWHGRLWLIDHGATMIWQHNWAGAERMAARPYDAREHVLLRFTPDLAAADAEFGPLVTERLLREVVDLVPEEWLLGEPGFDGPAEVREAYVRALLARTAARENWVADLLAALPDPADAAARQEPSAATEGPDNRPDWLVQRLAPRRTGER
jgi:hypothetical protein